MDDLDVSRVFENISLSPERHRTARRRVSELTPPSADTLELARSLALRVHNRSAQIRRLFVARPSPDDAEPPLAVILRSGRGSAVRLKLYLSLLWIASGHPHAIRASASAWAELLDLEDRPGKGARQIRSGLRWLADHHLVKLKEIRGSGSQVTLLSDTGNGSAYRVPGVVIAEARRLEQPPAKTDLYIKLPDLAWTHGWLHALSGPALAMLLVLLDTRGGQDPDRELWLSERVALERYTLSEETRSKGLAELDALGLVTTSQRAVRNDQLGAGRRRYVYRLHLEALERSPL